MPLLRRDLHLMLLLQVKYFLEQKPHGLSVQRKHYVSLPLLPSLWKDFKSATIATFQFLFLQSCMFCDLNLSSFKIREKFQEDKNKHKVKKNPNSFAIKFAPGYLRKQFSSPLCFNTAEPYAHSSTVTQCVRTRDKRWE